MRLRLVGYEKYDGPIFHDVVDRLMGELARLGVLSHDGLEILCSQYEERNRDHARCCLKWHQPAMDGSRWDWHIWIADATTVRMDSAMVAIRGCPHNHAAVLFWSEGEEFDEEQAVALVEDFVNFVSNIRKSYMFFGRRLKWLK